MDNFRFAYRARVRRDANKRYLIIFPDFPEAATDGESRAEAIFEAEDCLEEAIAGRIRRGDPIPRPSISRSRDVLIAVPTIMATKAALYNSMYDAGVTNVWLANKLDVDEKEVRRLLDPHAATKLPRLLEALKCLNQNLVVEMCPASKGDH
jgi:antitoxin HicB